MQRVPGLDLSVVVSIFRYLVISFDDDNDVFRRTCTTRCIRSVSCLGNRHSTAALLVLHADCTQPQAVMQLCCATHYYYYYCCCITAIENTVVATTVASLTNNTTAVLLLPLPAPLLIPLLLLLLTAHQNSTLQKQSATAAVAVLEQVLDSAVVRRQSDGRYNIIKSVPQLTFRRWSTS